MMDLEHLLYEEDSLGVFILITIVLGGGAAWLAGRAIALTWRPWRQVVLYMFILAIAVRFLHFALFEATFLSPHYYLVDVAVCLVGGLASYRVTRARQMVTQYRWINVRTGAMKWARQAGIGPKSK
jgi:hypothetical protein